MDILTPPVSAIGVFVALVIYTLFIVWRVMEWHKKPGSVAKFKAKVQAARINAIANARNVGEELSAHVADIRIKAENEIAELERKFGR